MGRASRQASIALVLVAGAIDACARRPAPRAHTITIKNFAFAPTELTVAPGDTVIWSNTDFVPHTATASDSSWDSKAINGSATWTFVERKPGRHEYVCVFHPNMKATIVVR